MESGAVTTVTSGSSTIDVASITASYAVGFVRLWFSSAAVAMTGLISWSDAVALASAADASVAASFSPGFVGFGFNSGGVALTESAFSSGALLFASFAVIALFPVSFILDCVAFGLNSGDDAWTASAPSSVATSFSPVFSSWMISGPVAMTESIAEAFFKFFYPPFHPAPQSHYSETPFAGFPPW
jgi:hypothetical protein